jgi:type I restriction enzyme S subunit
MSRWIETTIGEQATLQRGIDITKAEQRAGKVPVISSGGVSSYHDTAAVKGPGVVLGRKGVVGSVFFVEEDYWPHDTSLWVKDFHGNDPRFVYYFFKSIAPQIAQMDVGSANPTLNRNHVHPIPISWPPFEDQKTIAAVLGALDDKIQLNRRMNATLEAMARALFQSWFVDFDPVRAKLDGRQPPGLDPATAALFPNEFEDSELGPIPKGWEVRTIEQLAERVAMGPFGSDIKVSTFVPKGIPVVSGQHLRGTLLDDSEFNFVTVEHADRLKRSNVQRGDVIFTHAGSIGQVAYIPETSRYQRYIISQRQFYMRCNHSVISPFYIASYFKTPEGQHRLLANTSSTGVPSISQPVTYLRRLQMVVPPPALLKIFDATVSSIHLKMADNDQQTRTLATLRDTLLPKLLSGALSISKEHA